MFAASSCQKIIPEQAQFPESNFSAWKLCTRLSSYPRLLQTASPRHRLHLIIQIRQDNMSAPEDSKLAVPPATPAGAEAEDDDLTPKDSKSASMRKLFGFGKKKEGEKGAAAKDTLTPTVTGPAPLPSPPNETKHYGISPQGSPRFAPAASASPGRRYRSTSPGMHSPASSQIFERNVQETHLAGELSPAIPSHIQTEDHIPPVLEASSLAITDDHLGPDEVEIIMHSAHLPAVTTMAGDSSLAESISSPGLPPDETASLSATQSHVPDEGASTYGSMDPNDVRRLSFISFADVVQAEHVEQAKDPLHLSGASPPLAARSPSPVRSPTASTHGLGASPPTGGSPDALAPTSPPPGAQSPPLGTGELTIQTMRQALRKTGSGDLSGARSPTTSQREPTSPVSADGGAAAERAPFR